MSNYVKPAVAALGMLVLANVPTIAEGQATSSTSRMITGMQLTNVSNYCAGLNSAGSATNIDPTTNPSAPILAVITDIEHSFTNFHFIQDAVAAAGGVIDIAGKKYTLNKFVKGQLVKETIFSGPWTVGALPNPPFCWPKGAPATMKIGYKIPSASGWTTYSITIPGKYPNSGTYTGTINYTTQPVRPCYWSNANPQIGPAIVAAIKKNPC